jgi:predicted RND superfamily exporter protein
MIILLALIIFRGFSAILIACSGPGIGVFWTIGWLSFVGDPGNDLTNLVLPVMVLIIGFMDSVHFVVHIRQERIRLELLDASPTTNQDVKTSKEIQRATAASGIRHVGMACLLTSITTAIGFGSLMIAET